IRGLYARGATREEILKLFRFIDWLIVLPKDLTLEFHEAVTRLEGETMPYVTSIERLGFERGREEGREEGVVVGRRESLKDALIGSFDDLPGDVVDRLEAIRDLDVLRQLQRLAAKCDSLEAFVRELS